jgi:hypothetical protein
MRRIKSFSRFTESLIDLSNTYLDNLKDTKSPSSQFMGKVIFDKLEKPIYAAMNNGHQDYYEVEFSKELKDEIRKLKGIEPEDFLADESKVCKKCNDTGRVECDKCQGKDEDCDDCYGTNEIYCPLCDGDGSNPPKIEIWIDRVRSKGSKFKVIHFTEGIPNEFKGVGLGYHIYKEFIKFLGWAMGTYQGTDDSKKVWSKLLKDNDFYSGIIGGYVVSIDKRYKSENPINIISTLISSIYPYGINVNKIRFNDDFERDFPKLKDLIETLKNTEPTESRKLIEDSDLKYTAKLTDEQIEEFNKEIKNRNITTKKEAEKLFYELYPKKNYVIFAEPKEGIF